MMKYKIEISGYGAEIVIGTISKETYEHFENNEIDVGEFTDDWDDEMGIPEELKPFPCGEWENCDDIYHEYGAELSQYNTIIVSDEDDNEIWSHNLDEDDLNADGIVTTNQGSTSIDDIESGTHIFIGTTVDNGTIMYGEFECDEFTPSKLGLDFGTVDINTTFSALISGMTYDGEDIDNDGGSTTGKSCEFSFERIE